MTKKLTLEDIEIIADSRNHIVIDLPNYQNVESSVTLYCKTCGEEWKTTVKSYKNSKQTGCIGCKKIQTSIQHKGKIVSESTKRLISLKVIDRPGSLTGRFGENHPRFKGGYGRDFTESSNEDYIWKNAVRLRYNYKCAITNSTERCCCHHLNGWNLFPDQRYDVNNGVFISYEVHKKFHNLYKYGDNTENQWAAFVSDVYQLDWFK